MLKGVNGIEGGEEERKDPVSKIVAGHRMKNLDSSSVTYFVKFDKSLGERDT